MRVAQWQKEGRDVPGTSSLSQYSDLYTIPLISKGNVLGVLGVFLKDTEIRGPQWIKDLEMIGGQIAIALDSLNLIRSLEEKQTELLKAYEETLEGWAKALALKEEETEEHSRRVTALTVELAKEMGIKGEELVFVRYGALLHDIGKIGIPDAILLKRGSLTEEEWAIMKMHTVYGYRMLNRISYLRGAIDIPRYHHEKWDGSGYPEGLKGTEIPLPARIFAVVDVWDALTSDRPYRKAWSKKEAMDYIKEKSGVEFDPRVVEVFIRYLEQKEKDK